MVVVHVTQEKKWREYKEMYIFQLSKRYKNAKIQPVHTLGRAHHLLNIDLQNLLPKHLNIDPQLPHSQRPVQSKS